jgi:hypothetical protein
MKLTGILRELGEFTRKYRGIFGEFYLKFVNMYKCVQYEGKPEFPRN